MKQDFLIPFDHFQFFVEDGGHQADTSDIWDAQAAAKMFATASGLIAVGTPRYGGLVKVELEIRNERPQESLDVCDQIIEGSIDIPSGQLVIYGPESHFSSAPRFTVEPGTYRVLVCYNKLDSVTDEYAEEGEDHYRLICWPDTPTEPQILKPRSLVDQT